MKFIAFLFFSLLSLPGLCQGEDDKLLQDLEIQRQKQIELAKKMNEAREKLEGMNATEELQKLGHKTIDAASLMDENVVRLVQKMMDQSPLRNIPPDEVKTMLLLKNKDSMFGKYLENNPRVLDATVDLLRDGRAMSSAVGLFLRKDALKLFFFIWICFLIESYLLKRIILNPKWSWWNYKFMGLSISLSITALSLFTFYKIFYQELSPAVTIILNHWSRT